MGYSGDFAKADDEFDPLFVPACLLSMAASFQQGVFPQEQQLREPFDQRIGERDWTSFGPSCRYQSLGEQYRGSFGNPLGDLPDRSNR